MRRFNCETFSFDVGCKVISRLKDEPRGRIFLVQVARAFDYAKQTGKNHLVELLREFVRECDRKVRDDALEIDNFGMICADKSFYRRIVLERQGVYLHQDAPQDLDRHDLRGVQLATVVSFYALRRFMLHEEVSGALPENASLFDIETALSDVGPELWRPDARVGLKHDPESNHFWASRFDALKEVAPSLATRPEKVVLPRRDADRIRDHLGLGHFSETDNLALLVFDEDMLETEFERRTGAGGEGAEFRLSRPFLFEGVGNHRFYIFHSRADPGSERVWNNALELSALTTRGDPCGGPEVVLTSVPCTKVKRLHVLTGLTRSACFEAEAEIERIMIAEMPEDADFDSAVETVLELLDDDR